MKIAANLKRVVMSEQPSSGDLFPTSMVVRRPIEFGIAEGNILELPLFVLSSREAKPRRGKSEATPYTREIDFGEDVTIDGELKRKKVRIVATEEYGYPTPFAARVLYAILNHAQKIYKSRPSKKNGSDWPLESQKIPISRFAIAQELGISRPSSTDYNNIYNACMALKTTTYEFHATWWDTKAGTKRKVTRAISLLDDAQVTYDERTRGQAELPLNGPSSTASQPQGFVRLGSMLYESLTGGYCLGIDLPYINALGQRPLAHRLYVYLSKKDTPDTPEDATIRHSENVLKLARKLGLSKLFRSAVVPSINEALEVLKQDLDVGEGPRRRFVHSWGYDGDTLTVEFFRDAYDQKKAAEARAEREKRDTAASEEAGRRVAKNTLEQINKVLSKPLAAKSRGSAK